MARNRYVVSPSEYDDIGAVLLGFGSAFCFDEASWNDLCNPQTLQAHEVVYLNCAEAFSDGHYREQISPVIRAFVEQGGTLYASDWALAAVMEAFPQRIAIALCGDEGDLECRIVDRGLREVLGTELTVHFDLPGWAMITAIAPDVRVYVEAKNVRRRNQSELFLPVVVSFQWGRGHVIATSFHNEHQLSAREKALLRYLALRPALSRHANDTKTALASRNANTIEAEFLEVAIRGTSAAPLCFRTGGGPLLAFLNWQGAATINLTITAAGRIVLQKASAQSPLSGEIVGVGVDDLLCVVTVIDSSDDCIPYVLTLASAASTKPPPPPPIAKSVRSVSPSTLRSPPPPPPPPPQRK